jgi:hypothetical protein
MVGGQEDMIVDVALDLLKQVVPDKSHDLQTLSAVE